MTNHTMGGGKKRVGLETGWNENIIMQLKTVIDLQDPEGSNVRFKDYEERLVEYTDALDALRVYANLKTTQEKEEFANKLYESPESFIKALDSKMKEIIKDK